MIRYIIFFKISVSNILLILAKKSCSLDNFQPVWPLLIFPYTYSNRRINIWNAGGHSRTLSISAIDCWKPFWIFWLYYLLYQQQPTALVNKLVSSVLLFFKYLKEQILWKPYRIITCEVQQCTSSLNLAEDEGIHGVLHIKDDEVCLYFISMQLLTKYLHLYSLFPFIFVGISSIQ